MTHIVKGSNDWRVKAMMDGEGNELLQTAREIDQVQVWFGDGDKEMMIATPVDTFWFHDVQKCRKFYKDDNIPIKHWKHVHGDRVHQCMEPRNEAAVENDRVPKRNASDQQPLTLNCEC